MKQPIEAVLKSIRYEPETGLFYWLKKQGHGYRGRVAGTVVRKGYIHIRVNGETFQAHRLAWTLAHGEEPCGQIDHINRDKKDNRIANLRCVDRLTNARNVVAPNRNSSSNVRNVYWAKVERKWIVKFSRAGKTVHWKSFADFHAAVAHAGEIKKQLCPEAFSG